MKISNINTLKTCTIISKKNTFKASQVNYLQKHNAKKVDSLAIVIPVLGAVGLAIFFLLSRKPQKAKTSIKNLQYVESKAPKAVIGANLKKIPEYSKELVGEASVKLNEYYAFLKRNPKNFYLENGKEINKFLRNGELKELPTITDDMPESIKTLFVHEIVKNKDYNRAIVESVSVLDSMMTSRTTKPMTVYRDAPASWLKTAKNGIIKDEAFLSTSTVPGASIEGMLGSNAHLNKRYKILLPENFPFLDLTYTSEKEMLLPRGLSLRVIADDILEVIV